ncbi:hypothetical protein Y032_0024g976 [Ancylostoma ceylanicum]|uniref:Uncharacterized protein n=1 Tax=Ancylostoma ceylanicum TaxID=53326 RepID=A0A016UWS9_9BILA|nr:hypothetical protein Y032_0024g976 [Ancylostoma ceylanicum]
MFSSEFRARFSSWHCGPSMVVCQNICLATSQIKMTALFKNDQLMNHLFGNTYDAVSVNKTVSQLYQINLLDPLSGASVILPPNVIQYSVYIPLTQYQPSNYYACLLFVGKVWDETKCLASSFAKRFDGVDHIECKCSSAGMLSVATVFYSSFWGVHHCEGKKGRNQATLIGAFGPPLTPNCLNSNGVPPIIHDSIVFNAVQIKQVGSLNVPIRRGWLRFFFPMIYACII